MPFRTKDFLLFIVTVAFLLLGIVGTVASDVAGVGQSNQAAVIEFITSENNFVAELSVDGPTLDRPSRLATLKAAVSERLKTEPKPPVEEVLPVVATESPTSGVTNNEPTLCSDYQAYTSLWEAKQLNFEVVEGARLLFRNGAVPDKSSTLLDAGELPSASRLAVLQLPLPTYPNHRPTCLSSDVIGVALDGSLIRNAEVSLYQIFSDSTLIGYALDGFPIYGLAGTNQADQCGGLLKEGEYGYYLSAVRSTIVNCFAGTPVALP